MDKLKHFLACAAVTLIVLILFAVIPHGYLYGWDKGIAVIIGCLAAVGKEIVWDLWLGRGTEDYYDFFWGVCGSFAAMFAWVLIETILLFI